MAAIKHEITLSNRQLELVRDLLEEALENLNEDIEHFEAHPEELAEDLPEGVEPPTIEDYEEYRDEVETLLGNLPDPVEEDESEEG